MLLGMLWLQFCLFHESEGVWNYVGLIYRLEYEELEIKQGSCGNEGRIRVGHWKERPKEKGSICGAFILLRDNAEFLFILLL